MFLSQYHANVQDIQGPALDADFYGKCTVPKHAMNEGRCALKSATTYYKYIKYINVDYMDVD
jgi:hypothetical protein